MRRGSRLVTAARAGGVADGFVALRESATRRRAGRNVALLAAAILALMAPGCSRLPSLPKRPKAVASAPRGALPDIPGQSDEFKQMQLPPGQLTRALPIGTAYAKDQGPIYQSLCLSCHSVSQTSFAVVDWQESLHSRAGVYCGSCHGTHEAGFFPRPGPDRCALCHAQEVEEFLASKHGPRNAPGVRCVSCHEPHATERGLAKSLKVCMDCHLSSQHVQGFLQSRMGLVLTTQPPDPAGKLRAADCVTCHMPQSVILKQTGDFRNDAVTLHDPASTVAKDPADSTMLARTTIETLVPVCKQCHSERNARYRLENADPLIKYWTPLGMTSELRRRPIPVGTQRDVPGVVP
ncbi:MAG: cytochrome c3 family protein [bacterium]